MEQRNRFLIGIDLGTTNSVVACIDTDSAPGNAPPSLHVFDVPQLVAPGEIRALPALPSFLYFPTEHDAASGGTSIPWDEHPSSIAGVMAREQGALSPGRQISSAKSWLCDPAVNRRDDILPPDADSSVAKLSPVEASARYLAHLKNAWNDQQFTPGQGREQARFEDQDTVLTVPASFDAEARELTVEAAQRAGLKNFILLEEPIAAFYAWIAAHEHRLGQDLHDGDLVLICDVGGGTTDFSLVRVRMLSGNVQFERTAIGEHLLLGGDNVDVALARIVEDKLGRPRLNSRQRHALRRACCDAKEHLFSDPVEDRMPITVLGGGRAVVGGALTAELTRQDVVDVLLGGFLPITRADEMPMRGTRRTALRELGLHYASDPAITKHLAEFLTEAASGLSCEPGAAPPKMLSRMQRPDAILFNGGFFAPPVTRQRIVDAVAGWFQADASGWSLRVLSNDAMESAVAIGGAYYGRVRRGAGLRIRAGSPRTFYVGLRSEQGIRGVCVLPSGVEEGTTLSLDREFSVLANRPASFVLFSSATRCDRHGEVAALDGEDVHRHAPLVTLLRYGKKLRDQQLSVRLAASFTDVGTLELWCESLNSPHRWRLQFELRGAESEPQQEPMHPRPVVSSTTQEQLEEAAKLVRAAFAAPQPGQESIAPESLVAQLETTMAANKDSWPAASIRTLCDVLLEIGAGRRISSRHEARWLNLVGFCLRPGFGAPQDEGRTAKARKLYQSKLFFPDDLQTQVEWLVLWRRIAGGLSASHQHDLYRMCVAMLGLHGKKAGRLNRQFEHEAWRLLAGLEQLPAATRASLGQQLLPKISKEPTAQAWFWSLGRLGSRIPLYGPLSCVVPVEAASEWLRSLLQMPQLTADAAFAIALLATRTDDHRRDMDEKLRREAASRLSGIGAAAAWIQMAKQYLPPSRADAGRMFGEPLPRGLQFVSSATCVLPLAGLVFETSDPALHPAI